MNINFLIDELKKLHLPPGKYAVFGSAVMAVRGIREAPNIDVIVTNDLWKRLLEKFSPDKEGFIRVGHVKISNWWFVPTRKDIPTMIKEAEIIQGVPFVKLEEVLEYKSKLNRWKDQRDVALIKEFLAKVNAENGLPIGLGLETYQEFLQVFINKIDALFGEKILSLILFGSVCRNQAKGNSDLDVFVFYDDEKITREETNRILVSLILELRNTPEYQSLVAKNIYPEIYPFLISKSRAKDTLWVFLDATDHGIVLKDVRNFGKKLLEETKEKIAKLGGRRVELPNNRWCWVLFRDFSQVINREINL
ncbi:nucleotidyltransferase domain-containing protein [bacterium]|nr:nucleotidyltransferase domain-containing protein [bacterium]